MLKIPLLSPLELQQISINCIYVLSFTYDYESRKSQLIDWGSCPKSEPSPYSLRFKSKKGKSKFGLRDITRIFMSHHHMSIKGSEWENMHHTELPDVQIIFPNWDSYHKLIHNSGTCPCRMQV